jgi:hypothetical protein
MTQSRIVKIGDALSHLANVAVLANHADTDANESISGRSFRCGWARAQRVINILFWWDPDHRQSAHRRDVQRAIALVESEARRVRIRD